jgi:hypothetical protein
MTMTPEERAKRIREKRIREKVVYGCTCPDCDEYVDWITSEIRAAVKEEREACARIAFGSFIEQHGERYLHAVDIAAAIRARGK